MVFFPNKFVPSPRRSKHVTRILYIKSQSHTILLVSIAKPTQRPDKNIKCKTFHIGIYIRRHSRLTWEEEDTAVMDARSADTAVLYRCLASSSDPPGPAPPPPPSASAEVWESGAAGTVGWCSCCWLEEDDDQRAGLQSSWLMEVRIWNAAATASSSCRCPSPARSCRRRAPSATAIWARRNPISPEVGNEALNPSRSPRVVVILGGRWDGYGELFLHGLLGPDEIRPD